MKTETDFSKSVATLTLADVTSPRDVANLYVDWLSNHEDDAPEEFLDYTAEELSFELLPYIKCDENGNVVVELDTEGDGNYNSDLFDSLTNHLRGIMTSRFMEVNWTCYDSRDGISMGTDYYQTEQKELAQSLKDTDILNQIAEIMSGQDWNLELLNSIADLIRSTGRAA